MTSTLARLTTIFTLIPLLAGPSHATAQDEQSPDNVEVAVVLDEPIDRDVISPHPSIIAQQRETMADEKQFSQWLESSRERILREHIFKLLSTAYMRDNAISVSDTEVDAFLAKEKEVYNQVLSQTQQQLDLLRAEADELTAKGQSVPPVIERDMQILEKRIKRMKKKNIDHLMVSDAQKRLYADAQRQRATSALRSWKFNRLIHEQYGGRVLPKKLSYLPYEAYATWLKVQEQTGAFTIIDEQLRTRFFAHFDTIPDGAIDPFPGMWDSFRWAGSGMP